MGVFFFFFFKQKTAYELGTGDWSSDVCLPISFCGGFEVGRAGAWGNRLAHDPGRDAATDSRPR